jgi:hypothetical protein
MSVRRPASGPLRLALVGLSVFGAGGLFAFLALRPLNTVLPSWAAMALYASGGLLLIAGATIVIGAGIDAVRGRRRS